MKQKSNRRSKRFNKILQTWSGLACLKGRIKKPTSPDSLGDMSCYFKNKTKPKRDSLNVSNWHLWRRWLQGGSLIFYPEHPRHFKRLGNHFTKWELWTGWGGFSIPPLFLLFLLLLLLIECSQGGLFFGFQGTKIHVWTNSKSKIAFWNFQYCLIDALPLLT